MNLIRPKLVTFDVTGTLLLTKLEHYAEIGARYGALVDSREIAPSFKQHFSRLSVEHPVFGKHTGLGWQNWWRSLVHGVFKDHLPTISNDVLDKVATNLIALYSTKECWHKYPGAPDLLTYLNTHDITIGVVSNFDERLHRILKDTSMNTHFSFVLTSYDHGSEKPELSIFTEALKLGATARGEVIEPSQAIHVGDNYKLDYVGAKNAGWNAFLMTHGCDRGKYPSVPDFELFKDLDELKHHFKDLFDET